MILPGSTISAIGAALPLSTRPRIVTTVPPAYVYNAGDVGEVTVSAGGWDDPAPAASASVAPILIIAVLAFLFLKKA